MFATVKAMAMKVSMEKKPIEEVLGDSRAKLVAEDFERL